MRLLKDMALLIVSNDDASFQRHELPNQSISGIGMAPTLVTICGIY